MIMVASYCRVSTDKEDQANSFASQQRYFKEYINRQPDWELYRVYADEGLSGTTTKKRIEFNQMISDAKMGKFKIILTKEVSRFSRNILDTIGYTRELKTLGVGVLFLNDGINTLDSDAELRLSIMGSIAQEESRKTSTRVKWGQTRQMERGVVFGRSMLGYDVKGGKLTINPEGAELVRLIFYKYGVEKKGTSIIAREMREAGYLTFSGNPRWNNTHIVKILKNEKYVGDLVQKKTYTPDYLTHQKKSNNGAEEKVCLTNHHEAIIDRDLWNTVQAERPCVTDTIRWVWDTEIAMCSPGKSNVAFVAAVLFPEKNSYKSRKNFKEVVLLYCRSGGDKPPGPYGNAVGCDIGQLIRDDFAHVVLKTSIAAVLKSSDWSTDLIANCAIAEIMRGKSDSGESVEKMEHEIQQVRQKKKAFWMPSFPKDITKEEMRWMNERYDRELEELHSSLQAAREREKLSYDTTTLQADVKAHIKELMDRGVDELFEKEMLDVAIIYPDRRLEVRLNLLPMQWRFGS